MEKTIRKAAAMLRACGQEHIVRHMETLNDEDRYELALRVAAIDFEAIRTALERKTATQNMEIDRLTAVRGETAAGWTEADKRRVENKGWELLKQGKAGAVVVAGGQGSRLGHNGPKGTLDIGLPTGQSLFGLQAERLLAVSRKSGHAIPWYVMTSPDNHDDTVAHFRSSRFFGMDEENVIFFTQSHLPAVDLQGKLLLESRATLVSAPGGNGDCFAALKRSGAIEDMKRRGVEWLFYHNVDNALAKPADPVFLGLAALRGCPIATKVVEKRTPQEGLGGVCLRDGRPFVIEYSELPQQLSEKNIFKLGSISLHLFSVSFVESCAGVELPFHAAVKSIPFRSADGRMLRSEAPNGYKLERLIYGFFPRAECMTVLEVSREDEFAPVKNRSGDDSPHTAAAMVLKAWEKESRDQAT